VRAITALLLALVAGVTQPAAALVTVVDTGAGVENGGPTLANTTLVAFVAGQFTVADATTIDTIEGWLVVSQAGSIDFALLSDSSGHPGSVLFTTPVAAQNLNPHWESVAGLDWNVAPGTYWVAFEPESGFLGYMPGIVPMPLAHYAFATAIPPTWTIASSGDFGVRVLSVPEPDAEAVALAACAALACVRARIR
jgi:hypothetical protein